MDIFEDYFDIEEELLLLLLIQMYCQIQSFQRGFRKMKRKEKVLTRDEREKWKNLIRIFLNTRVRTKGIYKYS
jgi:hypothetical protein